MKKIQRIYVDTSVIGGMFDLEFKTHTTEFFNSVLRGEFTIIISDLLESELSYAPDQVLEFYASLPEERIERCLQSKDSNILADEYIASGVVGKTSRTDCQHIALATLINADILISWNFKHIVNINRIRGYNSVNLIRGYKTIEIRNPREIIDL